MVYSPNQSSVNIDERVRGFRIDQLIRMPNKLSVVLVYFLDGGVHNNNKNVLMLFDDTTAIWQVQRDEQGKRDWARLHALSRADGKDGYREPFGDMSLLYADGTHNGNPTTGNPPKVDTWVPGCTVRLRAGDGHMYDLDVVSGIALNVTNYPIRPW